MCVVAFAWNTHPRWRLVLAGNRDEFHARPSAALAGWEDAPGVYAGRDLEGGGTWLGVDVRGRCALVTNVRDPRAPQDGRSRGLLASDYLRGGEGAEAYAQALAPQAAAFRPFNLLLFDAQACCWLSNHPQRLARPVDGVHVLSNGQLDAPWPKALALGVSLAEWLEGTPEDTSFRLLFAALADDTPWPDVYLPDTGIGLERERLLSPAFIRGREYGTRASTVVALDRAGGGIVEERRWGPDGAPLGRTRLELPAA